MKLVRFLIPIVIAIALGPLVAGLAVFLFSVGIAIFGGSADLVEIFETLAPMFGLYVMGAYVIGWHIALLAGALVSIWMIWRPPTAFVTIAAAVIATSGYMAVGAVGILGPVELTNARSNFLFTLVLAVIAAAACWALTRRFVTAPGAVPNKVIS